MLIEAAGNTEAGEDVASPYGHGLHVAELAGDLDLYGCSVIL